MTRASRFEGTIGKTIADSEPWFDEPPHAAADAPNVVVVLLDDTGFAQFGCYGSDIDTPNVDALAVGGAQFTNFHVTPLCSPTRASLLTGRSQHAVGMRSVSNFRTGFPSQLGHISNHAATVAEVLRDEGYATFCVGKWHLAPMEQCSAAGPFEQWPLARGFDRFYGFLEGETDQFHPSLVCDNHMIDQPASAADGYHVSEDMIDQLLKMASDSKGVRPDRPFFAYVPFGATHAPHQAPQAYMDKYRGRYDEGWDVVRERWFARQLELGVIPEGTQLAPRNPGVDAWDDLSENQQRFNCRLQEAFAAFLDHTDDQIGRLVDGLREMGELDNTVIMVLADNGASQEGGPFGVMHEMKFFNGIFETGDQMIDQIDDIGGPHSHTNYPWGWAQTGNSPFKWYKQNTHEGGVHVPMIVNYSGPAGAGRGVSEPGVLRDQFVNVSDIVPTIYELVGANAPDVYRGLDQLPVTGRSFASALADASAPAENTVQYFEMAGSRALIAGDQNDLWKAVCKHDKGADYDTEPWELYHLSADWSECNDLAATHPDKLAELQALWWEQAATHGVLPLDDRMIELFGSRFRDHSPHPVDKRYVYRPPMSPMPGQASVSLGGSSFDLTARVTREAGQQGVLYATGTENSGVSIFVQDDKLIVDYNAFDDHLIVESDIEVPVGSSALGVHVRRTGGKTGTVSVSIDGAATDPAELPLFMTMMSSVGPSVGYDHGSAVSQRYAGPFPFEGTLHDVTVQLLSRDEVEAQRAEAAIEMSRQ